MGRPLILLCNDDGYFAEGLNALHQALKELGDCTVVAPDQNCSGISHKISISTPLRIREVKDSVYTLNGSPVDCIHVALHVILKDRKPDLIVSGINHGLNLGEDTAYSGTVAAAYEGQVHGIPSVAISTDRSLGGVFSFKHVAQIARKFCGDLLAGDLPRGAMWNLNIPADPVQGLKFTSLDSRSFQSSVIERKDPRGQAYYWIGPYQPNFESMEGTDYDAFKKGFISATPLKVEMTHFDVLRSINESPCLTGDYLGGSHWR